MREGGGALRPLRQLRGAVWRGRRGPDRQDCDLQPGARLQLDLLHVHALRLQGLPAVTRQAQVVEIMGRHLSEVVAGTTSAQEGMDAAAEELQSLLERRYLGIEAARCQE